MSVESFASRTWIAEALEVCARRILISDDGDAGYRVCEERAQTGKRSQVRV